MHEIIGSPTNPHISHWTYNDLSKYENQLQATYNQPQQSAIRIIVMLKGHVTSGDIPKLSLYFDTTFCRIAILARAWKYTPTKNRLLLHNASIKLLFTYCCTVWSNCCQTKLDEQFKLQKCCTRLTLYCLLKPRTEAMRRTFFYSSIRELNTLNLEPMHQLSLT